MSASLVIHMKRLLNQKPIVSTILYCDFRSHLHAFHTCQVHGHDVAVGLSNDSN